MEKKQKQIDIPSHIRRIVADRDGHSCRVCGSYKLLEVHHIVRKGLGRNHDYCNLVLLCGVCHDYVENGNLPHWSAQDESKLYHISPVKAYMHSEELLGIRCKTHNMELYSNQFPIPINNYAYKNNNPVFK